MTPGEDDSDDTTPGLDLNHRRSTAMTTENNPLNPPQNRREVLIKGFTGALAIAGLGTKGTVLAQNMLIDDTPGLTQGPYWVDEMLNRFDIRSDPTTGIVQVGLPMALAINVSQLNADGTISPLPGAYVDIWHCNSLGVYSDVAAQNTVGQMFLRGLQVTNAHGNVKFYTIYPGWYSGRTPHIHARVRVYNAITNTVTYNFTTQFFFDDDVTNDVYGNVFPYNQRPIRDTTNVNDGIFNGASNDGTPAEDAGEFLLLRLFENRSRATGSFNIVIDLSDPTNANIDGDGGPGGPPPGGGGPGGPPPGGG
jgi:protocatechuate 3,4-dioxygenase beta subunit